MSELRIGSVCSGYGGLDMAVQSVLGGELAWFYEFEKAPSKILEYRWPTVPNHGDLTAADWAGIEPVDIMCGGTPCQDLSGAGKRAGMTEGTRSNLWVQMREGIAIQRPQFVVWENVRGAFSARADSEVESEPGLLGEFTNRPALRALGRVLGDLSDLGYDTEWVGVRASDAGAPHNRFRVFVLAYTQGQGLPSGGDGGRQAADGEVLDLVFDHSGDDASDPIGIGRGEGWTQSAGRLRRLAPVVSGSHAVAADNGLERPRSARGRRAGSADGGQLATNWGPYAPAIQRWERVLGRVAPSPTENTGRNGQARLSPLFVEWMMGLSTGWVTSPEIGLSRNDQLKALGNGVVPQQAELAIGRMLSRIEVAA